MIPNPSESSLAQQWAKKYVRSLAEPNTEPQDTQAQTFTGASRRRSVRERAADRLLDSLREVSIRAWSQTEELLADEVKRHHLDRRLVNPWDISQDAFKIFEKALEICMQPTGLQSIPAMLGPDIGKVRRKYTSEDPRVMAFVSMQFHFTGFLLQGQLNPFEQTLLGNCFKIIDDHLYMPLHRAYEAAAQHPVNSLPLKLVQSLLPKSGETAAQVVDRVAELYPNYVTYSGPLASSMIRVSSQRDVEMFQIYLWVSVLEQNFSIIQEELFPLCLMLYPKLKVHWELVRQMLHLLGKEASRELDPALFRIYSPYLYALQDMFAPNTFPETI
jgi:hypothetical protein